MDLTAIGNVVYALQPVLSFVQPIVLASLFLYFIRSFFD